MRALLNEENTDVVILSETKMKRPVVQQMDIGTNEYKVVQTKSSEYARGRLAILIKKELKIVTAEILREKHRDNFVHAIVITNRNDEAFIGWYNSPNMEREYFKDIIMK